MAANLRLRIRTADIDSVGYEIIEFNRDYGWNVIVWIGIIRISRASGGHGQKEHQAKDRCPNHPKSHHTHFRTHITAQPGKIATIRV